MQAATRQKEADKAAAEKAMQEDREKRKRRLDAGFAEVWPSLSQMQRLMLLCSVHTSATEHYD